MKTLARILFVVLLLGGASACKKDNVNAGFDLNEDIGGYVVIGKITPVENIQSTFMITFDPLVKRATFYDGSSYIYSHRFTVSGNEVHIDMDNQYLKISIREGAIASWDAGDSEFAANIVDNSLSLHKIPDSNVLPGQYERTQWATNIPAYFIPYFSTHLAVSTDSFVFGVDDDTEPTTAYELINNMAADHLTSVMSNDVRIRTLMIRIGNHMEVVRVRSFFSNGAIQGFESTQYGRK
ncbi:hypothetical protein FAZ15_06800 [Sphingobacterium olei]|uniref:DUF4369 domain-containing protein n=1 Tax=Sphingobacterium olei TaxID=2571155 RepID=A0A4U0P4M1_9SPHI|nr:hypothetical protein [Sphingobacterium olei]TJZ62209.1 hypothetical protein FAZ15_06800 [Sphingobacterium olei]